MILNEFFNLPQVFEKDMTEAESMHTDMTVAQQVFKDNPDIDHEDDILNAAFPYVVELVGSRKRANYMFNYDEDFPGDLISAYRYLQRDQHDVGLEEVAKWRDPKYKGQLYTQEPPDYNDTREYDRAMWDPKPDDYPGRKELPGGGEYDRTDPLVKGFGRSGVGEPVSKGPRKGLPSRDQITSLKQSIKDISGRHTRANLPEQGMAEGLSKQFEIIYLDQSGERKRKIVSGTSKESVARQFKKQYKLEIEQVKQLQQGVAEGANDTVYPNATVIKSKNGKPVGEIYQDESGWGCFHYRADRGASHIESREEALEWLKDIAEEYRQDRSLGEQGMAEGHADQQRKVFKKNGHPVGEVGIDRESSPGVGQWYMKYYATGDDFSGYDSMEEAVADLKHLVSQFKAEGRGDYVPPKEADYGPEYQAMVRRVGQKARQQEKAKQQQPKAPVRESRLALLKQIIQS